jgi:crotonobetainyl-CoA:carnitine CoA-transferase CaiB-like acyl-CoA transferase
MNAGKECMTLDFATAAGRGELRALLERADIVIEASRPRALRQLGIIAEEITAARPELTWISITGYGRDPERENWIAYGDDAAVAAGLSRMMLDATGEHVFAGDAIADPLTGLHATLAAYAGYFQGGAGLVSVALSDTVSRCLHFDLPGSTDALRERQQAWAALTRVGDSAANQ